MLLKLNVEHDTTHLDNVQDIEGYTVYIVYGGAATATIAGLTSVSPTL